MVDGPLNTQCWAWIGDKDKNGYARCKLNGSDVYMHRLMAGLLDAPSHVFACHHCDNPSCINPEHIYAGDVQSNSDDMVDRGRCSMHRLQWTEKDAQEAIDMYYGGMTMKKVGDCFGVAKSTVKYLLDGKTLPHLRRPYRWVQMPLFGEVKFNGSINPHDVWRIHALRKQGWSQRRIAELLSVSQPSISNVLNGKTHS